MKKLERKMSRRKRSGGTVDRAEPKLLNGEPVVTIQIGPKNITAKKASIVGTKTTKPVTTTGKKHKELHSKDPTKGSSIFPQPTSPSKTSHSHKSSHHTTDPHISLFASKVKYQESQGFSPSLTKSADLADSYVAPNDTKTSLSDNSLPHSMNGSLTTRYTAGSARKKPKVPDNKNALNKLSLP